MTDEDKHAFARRIGYPHAVFLTPSLYDAAERSGYIDMRIYIRQKLIPCSR